jgi:hypothetical protein
MNARILHLACLALAAAPAIAQAATAPINIGCDQIYMTDRVAVAWDNTDAYTQHEIYVNGALYATIGGSDDFFEVHGLTSGTHDICVRAYDWSSTALTDLCCQSNVILPLIDPPSDMSCDPIYDTPNVAMSWVNNGTYGHLEIWVDGVFWDTIGATDTFYMVYGLTNGWHELCVAAYDTSGAYLEKACCDVEVQYVAAASPPSDLGCDPISGTPNVAMSWTNNGTYSAIHVLVDGTLVAMLPGTETFYVVHGLAPGVHSLCVVAFDATGVDIGKACCESEVEDPCPTDVDMDGKTSISDLLRLIDSWGPVPAGETRREDVNGDGVVNILDLLRILDAFGKSC